MYFFKIYGMYIKSDYKIIGAKGCCANVQVDVLIESGNLDNIYSEIIKLNLYNECGDKEGEEAWITYKLSYNESVFFLPDTGIFSLHKGKKIIYKKFPDVDEIFFSQVILNFCLSTILIQREQVVLHGSGLAYNKSMCIICGESGSGKSTLANKLLENGYSFMADDAVALRIKENVVYGFATYPIRRLCDDVITDKLRKEIDLVYMPDGGRDKYGIDMNNQYLDEEVEAKCIFVIQPTNVSRVTLREITGVDAIKLLYNNLYKREYYHLIGFTNKLMMECLDIVNQFKIYLIERPLEGITVIEQADMVNSCIKKLNSLA